jgi:hypothetical protein
MLSAADVEKTVADAYRSLLVSQPGLAQAVRKYAQKGGKGAWVSFGILAHITRHSRLVLEALYIKQHEGCVVRVYAEKPLTFHYARKNRENVSAVSALVVEAAQVFQLHLPDKLLAAEQFAPPPELAHMEQGLMPIPPPLSSCDVPD